MLTPTCIPFNEWTEDMKHLDLAIRNCTIDDAVLYVVNTLEYGHNIPDDVIFTFQYDGGDFGSEKYYARFHKL